MIMHTLVEGYFSITHMPLKLFSLKLFSLKLCSFRSFKIIGMAMFYMVWLNNLQYEVDHACLFLEKP